MISAMFDTFKRTPLIGSLRSALIERNFLNNFSFYTTSNEQELDEIFRIRFMVYCEEYRYLDSRNYPNHRETDEFDKRSLHLVVRHKTGNLAATARLIPDSPIGLPIEKHFKLDVQIPHDSRSQISEVSRLIVARQYRRRDLLLVLIKGLFLLTKNLNINDIFCVLDDKLLPHLKKLGIPINKIGRTAIYQGLTAPYLIHVNEFEEMMQERNSWLLKFFSNGKMKSVGKDYKYALH